MLPCPKCGNTTLEDRSLVITAASVSGMPEVKRWSAYCSKCGYSEGLDTAAGRVDPPQPAIGEPATEKPRPNYPVGRKHNGCLTLLAVVLLFPIALCLCGAMLVGLLSVFSSLLAVSRPVVSPTTSPEPQATTKPIPATPTTDLQATVGPRLPTATPIAVPYRPRGSTIDERYHNRDDNNLRRAYTVRGVRFYPMQNTDDEVLALIGKPDAIRTEPDPLGGLLVEWEYGSTVFILLRISPSKGGPYVVWDIYDK